MKPARDTENYASREGARSPQRRGQLPPRAGRWLVSLATLLLSCAANAEPIDRHALVTRHDIVLTAANPQEVLQVGNGRFAFGVDVTGLQSFYGLTMSDWGWHSAPLPPGWKVEDFRYQMFAGQGRQVGYASDPTGQQPLWNWLRQNPHRINLGRLGLRLRHADGSAGTLAELRGIHQRLDLWRGIVSSRFTFDGEEVAVETGAHPESDTVAVRVTSRLLGEGRLQCTLAFPYGDRGRTGGTFTQPHAHATVMTPRGPSRADFARTLDATHYAASLEWRGDAKLAEERPHEFALTAAAGARELELSWRCAESADASPLPEVAATHAASAAWWEKFWREGGAVDLSGSTDPRWRELERRIVLSQYLLAVQEAGTTPPQESGLACNSGWYGKFHLEMHFWHQAHFALWNRWPLFARSLGWYEKILPSAQACAQRQGFAGARWPKMCAPDGADAPSPTGTLLIWQQPHPIFYAELDYRLHPTRATLDRWSAIVEATADFMASFATRDPATGRYDLLPPLKTVPENRPAMEGFNPAFEISSWRTGLRLAQQWRERLGLPRQLAWSEVLEHLAPLPQKDGVYLMQDELPAEKLPPELRAEQLRLIRAHGLRDSAAFNFSHPSVIGALGLLPGDGVDPAVMHATVKQVFASWNWAHAYGWDFPMMAMAAARTGEPELALDALFLDSSRNRWLATGSTGDDPPYPYYPSNGGLLYAIALMAAGWDGAPDRPAPGFPADGRWKVRCENLHRAP